MRAAHSVCPHGHHANRVCASASPSPHIHDGCGACVTRARRGVSRVRVPLVRADQPVRPVRRARDRRRPRRRVRRAARTRFRAAVCRSGAARRDDIGTPSPRRLSVSSSTARRLGAPRTAMLPRVPTSADLPLRGTPSTSVRAVAACPFQRHWRAVHGRADVDLSNLRCCRQRAVVCALRAQSYVERCSRANALGSHHDWLCCGAGMVDCRPRRRGASRTGSVFWARRARCLRHLESRATTK